MDDEYTRFLESVERLAKLAGIDETELDNDGVDYANFWIEVDTSIGATSRA